MIETSGHMPECPWPSNECSHTPMQDREPLFCMDCLAECICDRLRACEQRIKETTIPRHRDEWISDGYHNGYEVGYEAGRDAALTLARDAVAALSEQWVDQDTVKDALAAIDALLPTRVIDRSDIREISVNTDGSGTGAAALTEIASER